MDMEAPQVLLGSRLAIWKTARQKEWWYTGVYDPISGIYIGFSFLRVALVDSFHISVFVPGEKNAREWSTTGYLKDLGKSPSTSLHLQNSALNAHYTGSAENGWSFQLQSKGIDLDLHFATQIPSFTEFDNAIQDQYVMMHYFRNTVQGSLVLDGERYPIDYGLGYYDHCYGKVPRQSGWHWIAVQNKGHSLASLVNYGENPQKYSEIYTAPSGEGRWTRLSEDVDFGTATLDSMEREWSITSIDMELKMTLLGRSVVHTRIPPILPFLIKIDHYEQFVSVEGRVRLDGIWIQTGPMFGVFEQHTGWW